MASKEEKWKLLLNKIARHLTSTDINSIIFLQDIPAGIAEKLDRDGLPFLKALDQMGYIRQDNPGLLENILIDIPRMDLIPLLQKYTKEEEKISNIKVPVAKPPGYRLEKPLDFKLTSGQKKKKPPFKMESIPRGLCIIISNENFEDVQEDTHEDGKVKKADLEGGKKSPVENTCASSKVTTEVTNPLSTMTTEAGSLGTSLNKPSDDPKNRRRRKGTDYDEKLLADTFKWLHFEVIVHRDLKGSEMKATLEEIANLDHSQYNAFVCCILSHGTEDGVYGTDWMPLSFYDLRRLFSGNRCPDLHSKPKLFIIQACRGKDIDHGVMKTEHCGNWKTSKTELKHGERTNFLDADLAGTAASNEASKNTAGHSDHKRSADRKSSKTAPDDLNFVFAMSSVKGKTAVNSVTGSWFIKHLCKNLQENAESKHFMDMTDDITEAMSEEVAYGDDFGKATASAEFNHNLQRKVFFNPSRPWKEFYEEEYGKGKSSP